MTTFTKARQLVRQAHAGQVRKYTGAPYTDHLEAVAATVRAFGYDENVQAAALLHDVLEDTTVHPQALAAMFGADIFDMVAALTETPLHAGNRATRKAMDRRWMAHASGAAQAIKLADLIDNTSSIVEHDPKFARLYLAEKAAMLAVLTKANPELLALARRTLAAAQEKLKGA